MDDRDELEQFKTGGALGLWSKLASADQLDDLFLNTVISGYRVLERLGEGGMSWVYKAQREDGSLERFVALKLSKSRVNDELQLRFLQEQQIQSRMTHSNIGTLFDVGTTDTGIPFIVLEYLDADSIDVVIPTATKEQRFCWILELVEAVAHAHRHLVVHRDLKPSNVLIERHSGRLKLVDFGIAKSLETASNLTVDSVPHTPGFVSPEQMLAEAVTPASDVYQLGLMIYLIVTGERVVDQPSPVAMARLIQQDAATTISIPEHVSPDMRAIIRHCLRPVAAVRYRDGQALLDDLHRVQKGLPPLARDLSHTQLGLRYMRRHWLSSAAVVLAIAAGAVTANAYTRGINAAADEARVQASLAQRESKKAQRVADFLKGIFEVTDPEYADASTTLRDMVNSSVESIEGTFSDAPELAVELLLDIGTNYRSAGAMDKSEETFRLALDIATERLGPDHDLIAECKERLGRLLGLAIAGPESVRLLHEALAQRRRVLGDSIKTADAMVSLATTLRDLPERLPEAITLLEEAESMYRRAGATDSNDTLAVTFVRAQLLVSVGRYVEAIPLFQDNLERQIAIGGRKDVRSIILVSLAGAQLQAGAAEVAHRSALTAIEILEVLHYEPTTDLAAALRILALIEWDLGHMDAAIATLERSAAIYQRTYAEHGPGAANVLRFLAGFEAEKGNVEQARHHLLAAQTIANTHEIPNLRVGILLSGSDVERIAGDIAASQRLATEAIQLANESLPAEHPARLEAELHWLGRTLETAASEDAKATMVRLQVIRDQLAADGNRSTISKIAQIDLALGRALLASSEYAAAYRVLASASDALNTLRSESWSARQARALLATATLAVEG